MVLIFKQLKSTFNVVLCVFDKYFFFNIFLARRQEVSKHIFRERFSNRISRTSRFRRIPDSALSSRTLSVDTPRKGPPEKGKETIENIERYSALCQQFAQAHKSR